MIVMASFVNLESARSRVVEVIEHYRLRSNEKADSERPPPRLSRRSAAPRPAVGPAPVTPPAGRVFRAACERTRRAQEQTGPVGLRERAPRNHLCTGCTYKSESQMPDLERSLISIWTLVGREVLY